ncbi:MAG: S8 family serine peptidase, partial [Candidatus Cloacimonas sp.]|nr:S8 family serine peptidase [Candidatus Cloacimonas sp.]
MKYWIIVVLLFIFLGLQAMDLNTQQGTAVFKLKPEYRNSMQKSYNRTGISSLDARMQSLQVYQLKPYFQVSPAKSALSDIALIFQVSSPFPLQRVVNLLSRDEHVQYAEIVYPDEILAVPNDANYPASAYFAALEAEAAWDIHKGEDGANDIIIAVVDTGTNWKHPDLAQNIWNNLGEDANGNGYTLYYNGSAWVMDAGDLNGVDDDANGKIDDLIGWDFMLNIAGDEANDPFDAGSHGTIVSGIACARTNNSIGVSSLCWNLTLMPVSCSYGAGTIYRGYDAVLYAA